MNVEKRRSRVLIGVVGVVLVAVLAAGAYVWNSQRTSQAPSDASQGTVSAPEEFPTLILATRNDGAREDRSDASDREVEYKTTLVEIRPSIIEHQGGIIHTSIFTNAFGYRPGDNQYYFVNGEGEFAAYEPGSGFTKVVPIPDIKPVFGFFDEHSMYDFILSGDTVVYLQGACTDGQSCHLRQYNLETKVMSPIVDHLEKSMNISGETTVNLKEFDGITQNVNLRKVRNTAAGGGYADNIRISLETKKQTLVNTVQFSADEENTDATNGIFTKTLACGDAIASQQLVDVPTSGDADIQTTLTTADGKKKSWMATYIVGCAMPPYLK